MKHPHHWALCLTLILNACGGSTDTPTSSCNAAQGSHLLTGTVTAVHDGDTLTLDMGDRTEHIRLQGIDAPELAQAFGNDAKLALAKQTLQQTVRVAYSQRDHYDRVLGQVFTADCTDVNLQLLNRGWAWFYKAYACDLDSPRRFDYAAAEAQASRLRLGLWRQSQPFAPWIFRNSEDPPAPSCTV